MGTTTTPQAGLGEARRLVDAAHEVMDAALAHAARVTDGGKGIDGHQVHTERVAYLATEVRAARELVAYAEGLAARGAADPLSTDQAAAYAAEVAHKVRTAVEAALEDFGVAEDLLESRLGGPEARAAIRAGMAESRYREIGRRVIDLRGANTTDLGDEMAALTRDSVRAFARSEIAPVAQEIHRRDLLVSDDLLRKMAELGFFGSSIPEEYGGSGMGNLAMILTTEELSAASLAAGGSLITRPEILAKALLTGGTEEQKREWLPKLASGEVLVGVAVTEPDVGSDVASLQCRAERAERDGRRGWVINGPKAWSTFSGRADVLALLARTDPDPKAGARGLSLFMVPKAPFYGHEFQYTQPEGGTLTGTANPTPGYRGMHSFTLAFDNYFVPEENLVGGEGGLNRGFYLQMAGFAAGRLQTGGRACGVAQAALEKACAYVTSRVQFGRPVAEYQLTQYKIGRMATHLAAARQLTYAAARLMDEDEGRALEPAQAKLLACDVAVWVSQEGQLLHGGWGYSEEDPIARYVVDALVLPIFEGVKPILELRVIGRGLLAR